MRENFLKYLSKKTYKELLQDSEIVLVAGAAIPSKRCDLGLWVMDHDKGYFPDKAPFTTLDQLERARKKADEMKKKYMVYYRVLLNTSFGFILDLFF